MSTQLQDFREQYPQYANVNDEDLAGALHERYYPDMPLETYFEQLGLGPVVVDKEPEKPGVWDRISSIWRDEEKKPINQLDPPVSPRVDFEQDDQVREEAKAENDGNYYGPMPGRRFRMQYSNLASMSKEAEEKQEPRAKLRHQLSAGFDEMRANRATSAFFAASQDYRNAEAIVTGEMTRGGYSNTGATGAQIDAKIRAAQAKYGNKIQRNTAINDIELDIRLLRVELVQRMQQAINESTKLRERASQIPYHKETREMLEAETFAEGISEFMDDPVMIIAETSLRSLPNMAYAIPLAIGGAIAAGPYGFAAGMGAGAAMVEYRAAFSQYLQTQGVDLTDAQSMVSAGMNDDLMRQAQEYAGTRSSVIGTFAAISGGIATKPLTPFVKNVIGRELSNIGAQIVVQAGLEGTGEALAQVATGEDIAPGEVLAEMTGSLIAAPIEVGVASVSGVRAQTQLDHAAKIESEVNEILGRGDFYEPPTTAPDETITPDTETIPPGPDPDQVPRGTMDEDSETEIEREDVVEYFDQRLKRSTYRAGLQGMADELIPGGGITYIWEDYHITGRTKSQNPPWFQDMMEDSELQMSVEQLRNSVIKAVTGKKLGVRQKRVVQAMTDMITDSRLENVDYARQELEAARKRRAERRSAEGMQPDADQEIAGERYNEDEYSHEMSADSRIIFELMESAVEMGIDEGILEGLAIRIDDNQALMKALEEAINEHRRTARPATAKAQPAIKPPADTATADIFGDDTGAAQEIADEIRRRDQARSAGQESVETGDPGDLFSDARRQVDIDDQLDTVGEPGVVSRDERASTALPSQPQAGVSTAPGADDILPGPDLFADTPPDVEQPQAEDNLFVRYRQVETDQVNIGLDTVASPGDAAHIFSFLRKRGQEAFYALVTDAAGKPLNLIRHTEGLKDTSNVDPTIIVAAAANTPGAARIWYGHNHPSGVLEPSHADLRITGVINKALEGADIEFMGHILVGSPDGRAVVFNEDGPLIDPVRITPARRDKRLAVTTRQLQRRQPDDLVQIVSPADTMAFVKNLDSKNALIWLDNRNQVVGVSAFNPGEMAKLRTNNRVRRVLSAIDVSNASAAIVVSENADHSRNMARMINGLSGIRLLDAITHGPEGELTASTETGQEIETSAGTFSMRIPPVKPKAEAARKPRATGDRRAINREDLQHERRARLRRMTVEELISAYYTDPLTGLGNRAAFIEESPHHNWMASIDADSLKWINDHLGHDAGDAMLIAIGEALQQADVDAYHISGDEFYIAGNTKRQVQAALTLAEGILANQVISSPSGEKTGIEITAAIGRDKASADSSMEAEKKSKKGRVARGLAPKGATLSVKAAKPLDMEPGTNYVPMIGHTGALPIDPNFNLVLGSTGRTVRIPKVPIRREHVLAVLQKYFGKRLYQGRVRGKLRLGFYRPGHGEVRIKHHNDIEVAAHEIAHFLDDRMPWIKRLYKKFDTEIKSLSYDVKLDYEGWAEFMRLWMTQESEAMKRVPAFYDAFTVEAKKQPKLWAMLTDLQELMHAWTMQGARARAASKHGTAGASVFDRIRQLFPNNVLQRSLDGLRSIKIIEADLADHDSAVMTDAYERLRVAIGGANSVLEMSMFRATPKWREDGQGIEAGGESAMNIWGNDWGNKDVAMYMIARRAAELKQQGRENLMRDDEIAAWLKLGDERPELEDKFRRHQEFNQRMLDFAEGGGILNLQTRKAFEAMNKNYIPFHRVIESQINGTKVRSGGNPFQRLKGGTQNINNVWDNIVNNTGMIIRMAMVNDGKRTLFKLFETTDKLGAGKQGQQAGLYAAPIPKEVAPVGIHSDQVLRKVVESMGLTWRQYTMARDTGMYPAGEAGDYLEAIVRMIGEMASGMDELVTFWKIGQDPKGDNVDFYMDNGDKHFFEINDRNLMDSLRFMGPKGTNLVLAITGAFSATLRRGAIGVPVFQSSNFLRDTITAWLLSTHVKLPAVRALRVVFSRMEKDPDYIEMLLNGGGFANRLQGLAAQRHVIVDPTRLLAFYDRFMSRFENANRLAEYKAARGGGVAPRRAALLSRDISTDFAMRGSSEVARYLAVAVPFLNAHAQGLYRNARQFTRADLATSYAIRGLMLAMATMALYALNKDDERYKEMPEDIKDLYWVFFTGDGEDHYILFPKPFESGMLWGTLPERMFEYVEQENGKEFADALGWMVLETFNLGMEPQVFQPWLDLQRNKNFAGTPIIPLYLDNVEPTEQYSYYTSEAVRHAAQAMGVSPIKMEYILKGYLARLGTYAIGASDAMIRAATDPEDRDFGEHPSRGETWRENLLVRALIDPLVSEGPPRRTKYVTDLYDMIREAEKVTNTVALHQKRTMHQLEEYLENPEKLVQHATNEALQNARAQLSEIRTAMDRIRQAPVSELDADEKRVQLWDLTRQRNKVARNAVLAIQEAQTQEQERLEEQQQAAAGAQ